MQSQTIDKINSYLWYTLCVFSLSVLLSSGKYVKADAQFMSKEPDRSAIKRIIPPSDDYPHGLLEVDMGEMVFTVPVEYVAQNPANTAFFDVLVIWPTMGPRSSAMDEKSDSYRLPIRIMFSKHYHFRENIQGLQAYMERGWLADPQHNPRYPGLLEYHKKSTGRPHFYLAEKPAIKLPLGNPLVTSCGGTMPEEMKHECEVTVDLRNGIRVKYRFSKRFLIHWIEMHAKIMKLVSEFSGEVL